MCRAHLGLRFGSLFLAVDFFCFFLLYKEQERWNKQTTTIIMQLRFALAEIFFLLLLLLLAFFVLHLKAKRMQKLNKNPIYEHYFCQIHKYVIHILLWVSISLQPNCLSFSVRLTADFCGFTTEMAFKKVLFSSKKLFENSPLPCKIICERKNQTGCFLSWFCCPDILIRVRKWCWRAFETNDFHFAHQIPQHKHKQ